MRTVSCRVPQSWKDDLVELAVGQGTSISALVRPQLLELLAGLPRPTRYLADCPPRSPRGVGSAPLSICIPDEVFAVLEVLVGTDSLLGLTEFGSPAARSTLLRCAARRTLGEWLSPLALPERDLESRLQEELEELGF